MFSFNEHPPLSLPAEIWSEIPAELRGEPRKSDWANANKRGELLTDFIEGPSFDAQGNLYIVDIPFGRVFRITAQKQWSLVTQYDGEPNGLKFDRNGRALITDYRRGLLELDIANGQVRPLLERRNSEAFLGVNDLAIGADGDIYFTDQGQSGLHNPNGSVYRFSEKTGRLDCLLTHLPSPNGLVLNHDESVLFVAMTRDNSVWRVPLNRDGSTSKVGRFCSMFGTSGPDGLAMDEAGNLFVAHASLGSVLIFAANGEYIGRVKSPAGATCTNIAFGGSDRRDLYITESSTGSVLRAHTNFIGKSLPR